MTMAYARRRAGLLQRQVAEVLGVSLGTVAMWDTGRNKPRADLWLTSLGYQMSDEEKALQDGTHELYHMKDPEEKGAQEDGVKNE